MKDLRKIFLWAAINILIVIYFGLSGQTPGGLFIARASSANGSKTQSPGFQPVVRAHTR